MSSVRPPPTDEQPNATPSTIFVSDPSAEAEKVAQMLRGMGYAVVDVPMSMLIARVAVQRPRVILVDADSEGALDAISRLRELPDADGIDVVFLGKEGEALKGSEDAMAHEGSGFFSRPVNLPALVRKIEALTGGPHQGNGDLRASSPPPSLGARLSAGALPPPSLASLGEPTSSRRSSRPPSYLRGQGPATAPELSTSLATSRRGRPQTPLSSELEALLAEAEQRIGAQMGTESIPPTPEEEIEAVLPAEILSSLDEPIDQDDDADIDVARGPANEPRLPTTGSRQITSSGRAAETSNPDDPGESAHGKTHGGPHGATTGTRAGVGAIETSHRAESGAARDTGGPSVAGEALSAASIGGGPPTEYAPPMPAYTGPPQPLGSTLGSAALHPDAVVEPAGGTVPAPIGQGHSKKAQSVPPPAPIPSVIGPREAPVVIARAIAVRASGALCIEAEEGVRRAVLREGDLVTAASGVDSESLLAFLGARGELPREVVQQLIGKIPPFGRHAGAALVAHGHLRQDQLWPVLRAHAEWILGRALLVARGTAVIEAEPPGRLKGEPSVFGGSTGAEVLIEILRRVIAPDEAVERLGGLGSRISEGQNHALLSECALDAAERDLVGRMGGATLSEGVQAAPGQDFASVVYGLSLLGVVEVIRGVGPGPGGAEDVDVRSTIDALDEEAVRARVRARLALVEEADYFALLGVSPDATGYEVRRAFLDLRRTFDPQRVLTPQIADLADDVRKIVMVLEEAFEILRDTARRERYRRAIAARPEA